MKTLGALWIFLVIVGDAFCETIVYPGLAALQSYSPARGEFPVQSLFGRGYLSYIDALGNSKIVSLEPNPLFGVRVSASGQPLIEVGRNIDGTKEEQVIYGKGDHGKRDRLKPIKEFDENPFADSEDWEEKLDSKEDALSMPIIKPLEQHVLLHQIPTDSVGMARQNFPSPPQNMFNPMNPFLPTFSSSSSLANSGAGVAKPAPQASGQNPFLAQNTGLRPSSGQTQVNPARPPNMGQGFPNPAATGFNGQNPFLPTRPTSGPLSMKPAIPANTTPVFPNPRPPAIGFGTQNPFLTPSTGMTSSQPSSPTNPASSGQVILNPKPSAVAGQVFPNSTLPATRPTSNTGFSSNSPPPTNSASDLPSWGQVFPSTLPPKIDPRPSYTTQPPFIFPTSPPVVFSNPLPSVPVTSTTASPSAVIVSPSSGFLNQSIETPSIAILIDEIFNTNITQLTPAQIQAMVIDFDIRIERKIPEQVKDTPEVEEAKRGHFLAHELALAQLKLAHQHDDAGNESPSSSSLHLTVLHSLLNASKVASSQAVTSAVNKQQVDTVE